jgi:MFS superfamily sulfate permease-like transporter
MFKWSGPRPQDWVASLVVFIVAMPLSLGIALASGASPAAGLITAVAGGIVAGALAGAPLSVTGPAAGLTAIVFQLVQQYGIAGLAIITVLCGLIQLIMGTVRAGKLFTLIPTPVLEGVLSAIGLIIVLGQLHVLMGAPIPKSPIQAALMFDESLSAALRHEDYWVAPALFCGALAILIQLAWNRRARGKLKLIPGALPAVVAVTLLSLGWVMPRVELEPFGSAISTATAQFFSLAWLPELTGYLLPAIGLAVVASAESLLTARAVDILVQGRPGFRVCNLDRELLAQGSANVVSGMIGGIPMTAVMVRSAANVNSGGQTRWSTILHGLWIAALVMLAPGLLMKIPLTALAAVLILTGVRLINFGHFVETLRKHRQEGAIWLATTLAVFTTDLLKGLIIGIAVYVSLQVPKWIAARRQSA